MAKNQTYKAFTVHPSYVLAMTGELLDSVSVMAELAAEVRGISAYATYVARNDEALGAELAQVTATVPAEAGRRAGITMPSFFLEDEDGETIVGTAGKSRKEKLIQYNAVTAFRSRQAR